MPNNTSVGNTTATQASQQPIQGSLANISGTLHIFIGGLWVPFSAPISIHEEDEMLQFKVSYKASNVNSKQLLTKFVTMLEETAKEFIFARHTLIDVMYDYSQLVEYLDAVMEDMTGDKVISTSDILGDYRNNKYEDVKRGTIRISIKFKQYDCLNITKIDFLLEKI